MPTFSVPRFRFGGVSGWNDGSSHVTGTVFSLPISRSMCSTTVEHREYAAATSTETSLSANTRPETNQVVPLPDSSSSDMWSSRPVHVPLNGAIAGAGRRTAGNAGTLAAEKPFPAHTSIRYVVGYSSLLGPVGTTSKNTAGFPLASAT